MVSISLDELLAYTDEERAKWRAWLDAHPDAMTLKMQPDGRFATVGALIDHIFLVEARHLARLKRGTVPDSSGLAQPETASLFRYAAGVRLSLREYVRALAQEDSGTPREFTVQSGTFRMTPRKLLVHIALHETRHWAQIALAVRQAGLEPPGNHDLFFSKALE
jgi:uncharacterized damage-inducible protein DinB